MELFQLCFVLTVLYGGALATWNNLNCPAPRAPDNGLSFIFRNGELVHFRCHPGYIMRGKAVAYCVNNQWTGPTPECVAIRDHHDIHPALSGTHDGSRHHSQPESLTLPEDNDRQRKLFNWEGKGDSQPHTSHAQSVYGDGPRRLPLINGIWPPQAQQVMTLGPQSTPGPQALVKEEVDIAELRHRQLEEVKKQRLSKTGSSLQKKRRRNKKEKKYKNVAASEIDETSPRETVISLGATEDGDALSVAFAKLTNRSREEDGRKGRHHFRHERPRKRRKGKGRKWRNPEQYSSHIISRSSRVDTSGSSYSTRHRDANQRPTHPRRENEVAELRGRPVEQVKRQNQSEANEEGSIYPVSEFDTSCLQSLYGHEVPMIAPQVTHAFVYRYETRKNKNFPFNSYLQVKYRCLSGFSFVNHKVTTLNCRQAAWVGEVPRCEEIKA